MIRQKSKKISVGGVELGGGAPISVQSMCNTKTDDIIDKEIDCSIVKSMNIAIVKEGDAYVIF